MRAFLVSLVVLALAGVGADRVAHRVATGEAEQRLAARGLADPEVDVAGFPFLTQLLSRRFEQVSVESASLEWDGRRARDVTATGFEVAAPKGGRVSVDRLSAQATVTYAEVLRQVGRPGLRLRAAGGQRVSLRRKVSVLGQTRSVTAVGRVEAVGARGQRLRVVPMAFERADGAAVDEELEALLADRFAVDYPLRALPVGFSVRRVTPGADGFLVDLAGEDVSFAAP